MAGKTTISSKKRTAPKSGTDIVLGLRINTGNDAIWSVPPGHSSLAPLLAEGYRVVAVAGNSGNGDRADTFVVALTRK